MKKIIFKSYHKIKQFVDVIRDISFVTNYKGQDENDKPIYEQSEKPTLTFTGNVKLHGTNAQVCYNGTELLAGKRGSLIGKDAIDAHFGFNTFVHHTKKEFFKTLMHSLWEKFCTKDEQISVYGEWVGKKIQKGVSISELEKSFFIFDIKIYDPLTDTQQWIDISNLKFIEDKVYVISDFKTFKIDIDFNNPKLSQNKMVEITNEVERECPVAKQFGHSGVGEGVVWTTYWKGQKYIFKVKGKKHSSSKTKNLAPVDLEVLKNIQEFVDYACTENRIKQGITETGVTEKKDVPALLRWVARDIIAEESKTLEANGLEWKQVARECNDKTRRFFFQELDLI